jgi:hypothetical protein
MSMMPKSPRSLAMSGVYVHSWQERVRNLERRFWGYALEDLPPAIQAQAPDLLPSPPGITPPHFTGRQIVTDALGYVASLPAPTGILSSIRGGVDPLGNLEVADPKAKKTSPLRWLTSGQIAKIKRILTPPDDKAELISVTEAALKEGAYFDVFRAKHIFTLIAARGQDRTKDQQEWMDSYRLPDWFVKTTGSDRLSRRIMCPKFDAPYAEWRDIYAKHPPSELNIRGVSRNFDGSPDEAQLHGRNLFAQIAPMKPTARMVERRTRNTAYYTLLPLFAMATGYQDKIAELNLSIDAKWVPKRFPSPENVDINEFVKHAASCGLDYERAQAVSVFAKQWIMTQDIGREDDVQMKDGAAQA